MRLLLAAGADPRKYVADDAKSCPVAYATVQAGCAAELLQLLLAHGAEPDAAGPDGLSPYALATGRGRTDLAALLRRYGATDDATDTDATDTDRFLSACLRANRAEAQRQLARRPGLTDRLTAAQQTTAMAQAAQAGHTAAVSLMLDLGFPIEARGGEHGGTALHAAAYCDPASRRAGGARGWRRRRRRGRRDLQVLRERRVRAASHFPPEMQAFPGRAFGSRTEIAPRGYRPPSAWQRPARRAGLACPNPPWLASPGLARRAPAGTCASQTGTLQDESHL